MFPRRSGGRAAPQQAAQIAVDHRRLDCPQIGHRALEFSDQHGDFIVLGNQSLPYIIGQSVLHQRRAADLSEIDGQAARDAIKAQMQALSKQRDGLERKKAQLEAELAQGELTPAQRISILTMARQVQDRLGAATFEQKRELFDLMDLRVQLRNGEAGRWLDLVCILPDYAGALGYSTC